MEIYVSLPPVLILLQIKEEEKFPKFAIFLYLCIPALLTGLYAMSWKTSQKFLSEKLEVWFA